MKQLVTIRLDETAFKHVKKQSNQSRYLENLVLNDIQLQHKKPIVEAVKSALLEDEAFFEELRNRNTVRNASPKKTSNTLKCCLDARRCKHWEWDSVSGDGYVNILTGEKREV